MEVDWDDCRALGVEVDVELAELTLLFELLVEEDSPGSVTETVWLAWPPTVESDWTLFEAAGNGEESTRVVEEA